MRRLFTALAVCSLVSPTLFAQSDYRNREDQQGATQNSPARQIAGKVLDAEGQPLIGASVSVVNKANGQIVGGTYTNSEGAFSVSVDNPAQYVLRFSYVNYKDANVAATASSFNITLQMEENQLETVIVTGYLTTEKKLSTGSGALVSGSAIRNQPVQSFDQALAGRASGVMVSAAPGLNSPPVIRIRGTASVNGGVGPLVVVDGVIIENGNVSGNRYLPNNALGGINPADIETIYFVKDGAEAAQYGSRAANGVVVITTKRGKEGATQVSFESWFSTERIARKMEVLNAEQYMRITNQRWKNTPAAAVDPAQPSYDINGRLVDTDWSKEFFQNGFGQNHTLTISGATKGGNTSYYAAFTTGEQSGIIQTTLFRRNAARLNLDHKLNDWLKTGFAASYTSLYNQGNLIAVSPGTVSATANAARLAWALQPNVPAYNNDGTPHINSTGLNVGNGANVLPALNQPWSHPYYDRNFNRYNTKDARIVANGYVELAPIEGLVIRSQYGIDQNTVLGEEYSNPYHGVFKFVNGLLINRSTLYDTWQWTNSIRYARTIAEKHRVDVGLFSEHYLRTYTQVSATGSDVTDPFYVNLGSSAFRTQTAASSNSRQAVVSYFGTLNYSFADKYILAASLRRDGLSNLPVNSRWGTFFGVSGGWRIGEESFWKNASFSSWFNELKLRGSYSRVGNSSLPGGAYTSFSQWGSVLYNTYGGLAPLQLANSGLKWETSFVTDLGINMGFLGDRFSLSFDWYRKESDELVLANLMPPSAGIPGNLLYQNIGKIRNQGIELEITGTILEKGKFSWVSTLNYSTLQTLVVNLNQKNDDIFSSSTTAVGPFILRAGGEFSQFFLVPYEGVNPENGNPIYRRANDQLVQWDTYTATWKDMSGNPASAINASDRRVMGRTQPTYFGGWQNTFKYGQFDLSFLIRFSGGNYVFNGSRQTLMNQNGWNNGVDVLNAWTPDNKGGSEPRLVTGTFGTHVLTAGGQSTSRFLEKGDYVRMQNLTLGYTLPTALVQKVKLSSVRFYFMAQNLFLITGYRGVDPEAERNGDVAIERGLDQNSMPLSRSFTLGFNVSF